MNDKRPEDFLDDVIDRLLEGEFDPTAPEITPQEGIDELQHHLGAAHWLQRQGQKLSPSPNFIRDTWRYMKLRLEHDSRPPSIFSRLRNLWSHTFLRRAALPASVLMLFLVVVISPVVVRAAEDALPGDRLYPVKLSIERVQLVFALSEEDEIRLLSEQATERLKEAQHAAEAVQIENLEAALEAYQVTTSKYLDKLGQVDIQEIAPITEMLDQTALEQVHLLDTLNNSVTNFDTENQTQVRDALNASMEGANAFQDMLTQLDPTQVPPAMKTPTPTPVPYDEDRATPTPSWIRSTATPDSLRATPTSTSRSDINRPTPSATASSDSSKPPYTTPTADDDQNSLNGGGSSSELTPTPSD